MPAATADTARRDAARSRAALLEAAERVFAERGFDAATMQEIGAAAGLSRGAPGYFFGSKRALYAAVVERVFAERHDALAEAFAPPPGPLDGAAVEAALARGVAAYLDFLRERPAFVRLVAWEALHGGEGLRAAPHRSSAIEDGLRALVERAGGDSSGAAVAALAVDLVALCLFPIEHADTMLRRLGVDARSRRFAGARAARVARLLAPAVAGA